MSEVLAVDSAVRTDSTSFNFKLQCLLMVVQECKSTDVMAEQSLRACKFSRSVHGQTAMALTTAPLRADSAHASILGTRYQKR